MSGEETDGSPKEMLITALVNVNEAVMESLEVTVICSAAAAYWADVGALPLPSPTSLAPTPPPSLPFFFQLTGYFYNDSIKCNSALPPHPHTFFSELATALKFIPGRLIRAQLIS